MWWLGGINRLVDTIYFVYFHFGLKQVPVSSSVSFGFCKWMALKVCLLDRPLELDGTGGSAIPYLGYVEVNLQIPGIEGYNEDILLLVIPTMTCSERVPVMVGSRIIDRVMGMITNGELVRATMTWKQAHFSDIMSELLQLPHRSPWPYSAQGILSGWCPGACPYHTVSHHSPIWDHQYTWQNTHLRALHVGPCACWVSMGPPATHFIDPNHYIWGVTPQLILGANLFEEPEWPPHRW